jgi:signal transduction histidine kinase
LVVDRLSRPVAQFALAGLAVLAVFGAGSVLALRALAQDEALRDARQFAMLAGQGIVEPTIGRPLLAGDAAAIATVDRVVQERVLGERVVRVKLWDRDGRIVYSDEPRLIGSRYPLDASKRDVLRTGTTRAELSDLSGPENRYERDQGDLYEVYLPVRAPDGTPLLFETYQRRDAVAATGRRIWIPFAALMVGSLVLLWLVQVPLAARLGRRLRRTQEEREALLVRAVEASVDERRRIAADLHDGVVQDLAGISYSLSAAAQSDGSPATRETLASAAAGTRDAMRQLRSLLVEIHPPNLRASGLEAALADLVAPLRARGIEAEVTVDCEPPLADEDERLVYRSAVEALRNVQRHAEATSVAVTVHADGERVHLDVTDDGVGFTAEEQERRRDQGHVGLSLLEELATGAGGTLAVRSAPGAGTMFALDLPRR